MSSQYFTLGHSYSQVTSTSSNVFLNHFDFCLWTPFGHCLAKTIGEPVGEALLCLQATLRLTIVPLN